MGVRIAGSGIGLPETSVLNQELVGKYGYPISSEDISEKIGIDERRIAELDERLVPIASIAARAAIKNAGFNDPSESKIDQIIFATCTPDDVMPSSAAQLAGELGISGVGLRTYDLNSACTGFVSGLFSAAKTTDSWPVATTLLVGGDLLSRHTDYSDYKIGTLFGDGAGAFLLRYTNGNEGVIGYDSCTIPNRQTLYCEKPTGNDQIVMNGREVYQFVVAGVAESIERVLKNEGIGRQEIDLFVLHQANAKMILKIAEKLGVEKAKFPTDAIRETANTSAATVPIAYHMAAEKKLIKKGGKIVFCGFGAGLGIETVVWQT